MALSAGRLRDRIRIEEPNLVDNGKGGRAAPAGQEKWRTLADRVPAEVIALRGDRALQHLVERQRQLWRVTIRPRGDLSIANRLVFGTIVMAISAVAPTDDRDGLVLSCESGQG
ncbi:head-tail adaptor protein [Sphingomonas sp. 2378]|uniref:head-tail adaptor protein n=1 Tax=Sphingomonas sp. 2378 TaxID=1219748 RepID=UPI00311B3EFD